MKHDQILLDITLPRTLDAWVCQYSQPEWRGAQIEGWLFEGLAARRAAQGKLAALGVQATFRSAYKPLLHYFLEEVDVTSLSTVTVHYPVHPLASERRFLLEAYPLSALLPEIEVHFVPGDAQLFYRLELIHKDGQHSQARVFAPNRAHMDHLDTPQLSPTGWLRTHAHAAEHATEQTLDQAQPTDYETLFAQVLATVQQHTWSSQEPYFERLDIRVDLASIEQTLPTAHEHISSAEALHEDIYFSLLEVFQRHSGRPAHDRCLQPGQLVPDVRTLEGPPRLRMSLTSFAAQAVQATPLSPMTSSGGGGGNAGLEPPLRLGEDEALDKLSHLASFERIHAELAKLSGQRSQAHSFQGRIVHGLYHDGPGPAVLISAGQHANEASGVVGALRAAHHLQAQGAAHFALIALENPDGYALYHELLAHNPRHMLHAARYSALGDDIEYRDQGPLFERQARDQALVVSGARLHINLHGYPAHEWTRPLTGYVPRGFGQWTIPKGFFLILRYHTGWAEQGRALLEAICAALAHLPGLGDYNAQQMQRYAAHAGAPDFVFIHGIPCSISDSNRPGAPLTLITEFPDETLTGDAFVFAHTVQMHAVLAAVRAWGELAEQFH